MRAPTLAMLLAAAPVAAQSYSVPWWTVDGGGVLGAAGGTYALSATSGQPDAGAAAAGGPYALRGGFWAAALPDVGGPRADLAIVKTDSPDPVVGLQPLTYTLAVTNGGPDPATAVSVSDTLAAGVVFQSAGGGGWSCSETGGTVTCTRPALAVGAAPAITLVVTAPPLGGSVSNTASVVAAEEDPMPGNNADTEPTAVTAAPATDIRINVIPAAAEARWGQPFTYFVTLSNLGPADAVGATVTDAFPPTFTGVAWTCSSSVGSSCPASGSGDIASTITLLVDGDVTFTATGAVAPGTATLVNTASVALAAGEHDPNPANNSDTATTPAEPVGFYPLAPCRVADTRTTHGPALDADSTRDFDVAGECGVPADARAVAIVLTVVNPGDAGNLRLYPAGGAFPTASTINFGRGRTRANNAIVPLGEEGRIWVRCDMLPGSAAQTHFVMDVTGYFR